MAKLVTKKTTTTVTEEVELIPATPGEEINHRYMKVCGYGSYRGDDGESVDKPQIVLNAKWLAEAGFHVGDQIDDFSLLHVQQWFFLDGLLHLKVISVLICLGSQGMNGRALGCIQHPALPGLPARRGLPAWSPRRSLPPKYPRPL